MKNFNGLSEHVIIDRTLEEAELNFANSNYGPVNDLITSCLKKFPFNVDRDVIAMKIGLIDSTNSTHLSQQISKITIADLSEKILNIQDIDARIREGDPTVVNAIANQNINLFAFASKYCCYHNRNLYGEDDYSIFDTVLKKCLPLYFNDIDKNQIEKWRRQFEYEDYNEYITKKLASLNITVEYRRRKFDHFVWYKNR